MFPCPICDVKLNSAEQRRAHCRGKNHIKREEARKKAEELGTDFDNTPDHCDVCNVPLTSKMTAIDHFKGKMHKKKVKAVEDQRQGFKNYCDICEVRLQSLKVSEAHFHGKQHFKRERKTNCGKVQGKKVLQDRKSTHCRLSRPKPGNISSTQNIFGVVFDGSPKNSTSWENRNCDNECEPKDPLSEFRILLSGKSLNSPDSSNSSSSPESLKEAFFCFDDQDVSSTTALIPSNTSTVHCTPVSTVPETIIPVLHHEPPLLQTTSQSNGLNSVFKTQDQPKIIESTVLPSIWESQANLNFLNATSCNPTFPFPSTELCEPQARNGVNSLQSEHVMQTQSVLSVLRAAGKGISSGDIATKIAGLSPSDVNLILNELENNHFVSKSGCVPVLWSLVPSTQHTNTSNSHKHRTLNGFSQPAEKILVISPKEPRLCEPYKDSYFNQNLNGQSHFPTTEAYTAAMLPSCSINTTHTTPSEYARPSFVHVMESNLVNVFQKNASLSLHEISVKLDCRDDAKLHYILQTLVERNVLVKDGDKPQRWRLATSTRSSVGVIGEERKRRSPVLDEKSRDRTPTPPKENGHCGRVANGCLRAESFLPRNGYVEHQQSNGFWQESSHEKIFDRDGQAVVQHEHHISTNNNMSIPGSLPLTTETGDVLDDLIVTTPKKYQRELYEIAMQEDTVCYLPCGTGRDLVMAQVIAHMAILNPTKRALVVVQNIVNALNVAQVLRKELGSKNKRKNLNVALHAGQLKQSTGKVQVVVMTSSKCLGLLHCGALSWKDVCLLIFDQAEMCCHDQDSRKILHEYYLKAKMDIRNGHVPKLLSFVDSSSGQANLEETLRTFGDVLSTMGDVFLSSVSKSVCELEEDKREAMFVSVQASFSEEEARMFLLLGTYLNLVFDNLAAQWQPLNSYRELLKISFKESSVISEAFVKLFHLTGQPLEKRLPPSCVKTWRHYMAMCEVIFALVECGEDIAKELLANLTREQFGFAWANNVGLPGFELSRQLVENESPNRGSSLSNACGSGVRELLEQLMIMQWENARVSSERPLALVIVKLNKTAKVLASFLSRCPELAKRNVKTTFVDGSRSHQQKAVIAAIKRRQYQVIVSTDTIEDNYDLPQCELVVLLDQPTSVYALEQLRKRRATNVVAICRDADGEHQLKELLKREELVEKAITIIRSGTS